jgi:hypothetical protein
MQKNIREIKENEAVKRKTQQLENKICEEISKTGESDIDSLSIVFFDENYENLNPPQKSYLNQIIRKVLKHRRAQGDLFFQRGERIFKPIKENELRRLYINYRSMQKSGEKWKSIVKDYSSSLGYSLDNRQIARCRE